MLFADVLIKGGTFMMGSPASEPGRSDDEVQHSVTVRSFYMGKYPVTQEEYKEVMGKNPSIFKDDNLPMENNLPVESVDWFDAVEYCNARSRKEGLTPVYTVKEADVSWNRQADGYRLPTEAEWEYACRAGTTTPFSTGENITIEQANYGYDYRLMPTAVGSFAANPWGLYDMHGNVWEWCWDWYGDYPTDAQTDPTGVVSGASRLYGEPWRYRLNLRSDASRVLRGGAWCCGERDLRSANRYSFPSSYGCLDTGFRLVRSQFPS